jgi:L-threonylcarbamoyladenylate synthase
MATRVLHIDANDPDPSSIAEAAAVLVRGGLVAFPTETVYGLGAHALDGTAVARIFSAKERPSTDPLIVHVSDAGRLGDVALAVPAAVHDLAARFWPGPLTLILRKQAHVPDAVTAGLDTVAVRVPAHPVAQALIARAAIPVAAPSANRFSRPSPTTAAHVLADLDGRIDVLVDGGPTPIGVESTILDLTVSPPLVRRPGDITLAAIRTIVPDAIARHESMGESAPQSAPGQLLRHYAPRAPLTLFVGDVAAVASRVGREARMAAASGSRVGILAPKEDLTALAPTLAAMAAGGRIVTRPYGRRADDKQAARELFAALRALDAELVDVILAAAPHGADAWAAVVDRLTRAAEGRVVRLS